MARSITVIPIRANRSSLAENLPVKKKVAAYARVSTDSTEQLSSFEAQVNFYTNHISSNPEWEFAGIYADEGITGTNTKKREQFNRMIEDCNNGKIDIVLTKSISRFARNTLDCLNFVRKLKELGVGIIFEKENINTLDSRGEVLLTILSSLAQDEARSISENTTWGIRRRYEQGKVTINHTKFLGYDKDKNGILIINEKQAKIIRRIFKEYLDGSGPNRIAQILTTEKVPKWDGSTKWYEGSIRKMLTNEKYKGDALLQKTFTVDFLTKKRLENTGQLQQFYIAESHPAIIDTEIWEAVQLEMIRRKEYSTKHNIQKLEYATTKFPFGGRIICGNCGGVYGRKVWNSTNDRLRRIIWQCNGRYIKKGTIGCTHNHIDEKDIFRAFIDIFNTIIENREPFIAKWQEQMCSDDILVKVTAKRFYDIFAKANILTKFNVDLYFKIIEKFVVIDKGKIRVCLLDGTELECETV